MKSKEIDTNNYEEIKADIKREIYKMKKEEINLYSGYFFSGVFLIMGAITGGTTVYSIGIGLFIIIFIHSLTLGK